MSDTDLKQAEDLVLRAHEIRKVEGGVPFVILPSHSDLHGLEKYLPGPVSLRRTLKTETVESFMDYYKKWHNPESELFASRGDVRVLGMLDEHKIASTYFSRCAHKVVYTCPLSREWDAWTRHDRRKMTQVEFAEFLEDRVLDVVEPPGADLMTLASQLRIIRKAAFGSSTVLATGEMSFAYSQENDTGTVEIPAMITLALPVFMNGTNYKIQARFKYRLNDGVLSLWYELVDPEKYVDDAFSDVLKVIIGDSGSKITMVAELP